MKERWENRGDSSIPRWTSRRVRGSLSRAASRVPLGAADITVVWPSGAVETWTNLAPDSQVTLTKHTSAVVSEPAGGPVGGLTLLGITPNPAGESCALPLSVALRETRGSEGRSPSCGDPPQRPSSHRGSVDRTLSPRYVPVILLRRLERI